MNPGQSLRRFPGLAGTLLALTLGCIHARAAGTPPRVLLLDAALAGADVVAVGERGTVARSGDSGRTWQLVPAPTPAMLTGIAFAPDGRHGWAVGHDATILGSDDAGLSWQKLYQGENLETSFLDVCALDADHIIVAGAYGQFLASNDGGKTWSARKIIDGDNHLNRITRGPTGTLYLAGEHGTLLRSTDRGATWVNIKSPYDGSFYGILPLNQHTLVAYGLRGQVYRSIDDGVSWVQVPTPQTGMLATAVRLKDGTIVLAGQARRLFVSRDDGKSFVSSPDPITTAVAELIETPDGALLAVGEAGVTRLFKP